MDDLNVGHREPGLKTKPTFIEINPRKAIIHEGPDVCFQTFAAKRNFSFHCQSLHLLVKEHEVGCRLWDHPFETYAIADL